MNIAVSIADMKVSDDTDATLVTHSLGSCIGLAVYDPVAKVGGMLHYMLPESELDRSKAKNQPLMFADTAIPILFKSCYELGAIKGRMIVKVAGGSQVMDPSGMFNIGKRNYLTLRKIFWKNGVLIDSEHVGGQLSRTLRMNVGTGRTTIRIRGKEIEL